jgi:hypothetical protein
MTTYGDLIDSVDKDGIFLNWIVTGDETWWFLYDSQLKQQLANWKSRSPLRKKKLWQDRSKGKVMLELFIDSSGIVLMEFIPEGATINKHFYKDIIHQPCISFRHKRPEV